MSVFGPPALCPLGSFGWPAAAKNGPAMAPERPESPGARCTRAIRQLGQAQLWPQALATFSAAGWEQVANVISCVVGLWLWGGVGGCEGV